jgi:hypothetical protein
MAHSTISGRRSGVNLVLAALAMPWNAFVAAFLYYTVLTLVAVGVADLPVPFMAVAYLLPVVAYVGALINRGVHALIALPIDLGETPHALQH